LSQPESKLTDLNVIAVDNHGMVRLVLDQPHCRAAGFRWRADAIYVFALYWYP
jgi:hypothetical protein